MANLIQVKRGVETNLPTLNTGEFAFTTDTRKLFIGDGTTNIQVALAAGIPGGQTIYGGTGAGESLTLESTSNATKGNILLGVSGGKIGLLASNPQTDVVIGAGKTFAIEMQTPQNVTATTAAGGTLNGTYYYKVSAGDGTGWTVLSAEVSATVDGGTTAGTITVSWDAVPGASVYRVWRGTSSGGQNEYYETTSTSINDDGSLTYTAGTPPSVTDAWGLRINQNGITLSNKIVFDNIQVYEPSDSQQATTWAALTIQPTGGNKGAVFRFVPSGTATASVFEIYNNANQSPANRGIVKVLDSEMRIGADGGALPLWFIQNNIAKVAIDTAGNLGVLTTAPTHPFHLVGTPRIDGTTATTATAGTATLPSAPAGFLLVNIGGSDYKIPYYNV